MKEEIQVGWALIPPSIIAREDLSANEKLVFGRILGLTGNEGYCYASNLWLGKQIGLQPQTISVIVSKLKEKELIDVKINRDDQRKITNRLIFVRSFDIHHIPILSSSYTPYDGYQKNSVEVSVENSIDNNITNKETPNTMSEDNEELQAITQHWKNVDSRKERKGKILGQVKTHKSKATNFSGYENKRRGGVAEYDGSIL
jgi:hypothetical protein